jgi:hypothetical protein
MAKESWFMLPVIALLMALFVSVGAIGCNNSTESDDERIPISPADFADDPARDYFKGFASVLPPDGDFANAYLLASQNCEFVSIWGTGAVGAVWKLGDELSGAWGAEYLEGYVRGNGMFPIIQMSFIDKDDTGFHYLCLCRGGHKQCI